MFRASCHPVTLWVPRSCSDTEADKKASVSSIAADSALPPSLSPTTTMADYYHPHSESSDDNNDDSPIPLSADEPSLEPPVEEAEESQESDNDDGLLSALPGPIYPSIRCPEPPKFSASNASKTGSVHKL